MNDYNLVFAIITALVTAAISYGVLKNQINVNTSNIHDLHKVIDSMNDLERNIELNKKDVELLKQQNTTNTEEINAMKNTLQKVEINVALILQKVEDLSKKIA